MFPLSMEMLNWEKIQMYWHGSMFDMNIKLLQNCYLKRCFVVEVFQMHQFLP